jgi:hypothetical protein
MTDLALQLLITALAHASELSALIQNARAENREVSDAELNALHAKYDTARAALMADIAKQKGTP